MAHESNVRSSFVKFSCCYDNKYLSILGALKATGNRGLQPAMDHILENEGQPIPELGGLNEQSSSSGSMDVDDEDEDAQALKGLGVVAANAVEAKVRVRHRGTRFNSPMLT